VDTRLGLSRRLSTFRLPIPASSSRLARPLHLPSSRGTLSPPAKEISTMPHRLALALAVASAVAINSPPLSGQAATKNGFTVGNKVLWKDLGAPLMDGNHLVCTCGDLHWPCTVEKAVGSLLWIGDTKFHGWVQKNDVMTVPEAIRFHSEELRNDQNVLTYTNRGAARYSNGDYDLAIEDYNAALRLAPREGACYCNRGEAWLAKKAYREAIADFTTAIRLYANPNKAYEAYRLRAIAYEKKGDSIAADADRRQAARLKWSLP
jgi:tetratricopeptide (TPR) repeat protein